MVLLLRPKHRHRESTPSVVRVVSDGFGSIRTEGGSSKIWLRPVNISHTQTQVHHNTYINQRPLCLLQTRYQATIMHQYSQPQPGPRPRPSGPWPRDPNMKGHFRRENDAGQMDARSICPNGAPTTFGRPPPPKGPWPRDPGNPGIRRGVDRMVKPQPDPWPRDPPSGGRF